MKQISKITALAAFSILFTDAAQAEKISLKDLSSYINALPTVKGNFTQVNPNGSKSSGKVYVKRPGKMRFEYNNKKDGLVVVSGGQIAVFDPKSNKGPSIFPLAQTPLKLLLKRNVDLSESGMVSQHVSQGKYTIVVARDAKKPKLGQIQMVFTDNPIELKQWVITDQSRQKTTIQLGDLVAQKKLSTRLFQIQKP